MVVGVIAAKIAEATAGVVSEITAREITGTVTGETAVEETTRVAAVGTTGMTAAGEAPEEVHLQQVIFIMLNAELTGATAEIASEVVPTTINVRSLHAMITPRHVGGETGVVEAVAGMTEAMKPARGTVHAHPGISLSGTMMVLSDMLAKCQLDGTKSQLKISRRT